MKKRHLFLLLTLPLLAFLASCKGDAGTTGTTGTTGPSGAPGLITMSFQDGVYPSNSYAGTTANNMISDLLANTAYYGDTFVTIGSSSSYKYHVLLKFDLTSAVVPTGVTVKYAYLTITMFSTMTNTINVYPVTVPWISTQTSWNNNAIASTWTTAGGDYGALMDSKDTNAITLTFSLSPALVTSWISSPSTNYGVLLKATDELSNIYVNIFTGLFSIPADRPRLTIYYSLP